MAEISRAELIIPQVCEDPQIRSGVCGARIMYKVLEYLAGIYGLESMD